ncbi:MAG: peptide chain release factor H [Bacteroidota bacterium]|nr:peptide chain release factor H [Pseudomonadota bacterium]MEA3495582.1 peptide chain release factor H [Bacteroidota bacterium]
MNQWLQITAGRGPEECCWVVSNLVKRIIKDAAKHGVDVKILDALPGKQANTFRSALLALDGADSDAFSSSYQGAIQWIGKSPLRPTHKRKNWFVAVNRFKPPKEQYFDQKDIKIETMRSSGPGGQHVNKSDTAVRITHLPSKTTVIAREERSQHMNKKLALARLFSIIKEKEDNRQAHFQQKVWTGHNNIERGNPIRVFRGNDFKANSPI